MKKDIFIFLLGMVVGAIFGLLFAPESGKDLRANLQSTAEKDLAKLQEGWQVEAEKIHTRLDQLQTERKRTTAGNEAETA